MQANVRYGLKADIQIMAAWESLPARGSDSDGLRDYDDIVFNALRIPLNRIPVL